MPTSRTPFVWWVRAIGATWNWAFAHALLIVFAVGFGFGSIGHCAQLQPADAFVPAVNAFDGIFTPRLELPPADRKYADWGSTGLVVVSVAKDFYDALKAPNRTDALIRFTIRDGSTAAIAEALKLIVHRTRPDGSNDHSWPSEHTMFAILLASQCGGGGPGPGFSLSIPLAFGTGAGRIMAGKHFASDVLSGAGIGWVIGHYTRGNCK